MAIAVPARDVRLRALGGHDIGQAIPQRFAEVVTAQPEHLAVWTARRTLTYAQLARAAGALAATIRARLGDGEEPVALLLDQGVDAVVAIVAVLAAGKFYLPLDTSLPATRLRALLDDAGARLVAHEARHAALAAEVAGARATVDVGERARVDSYALPPLSLAPDRLACLFYTSGSTGTPKGVSDCHRNVLHNAMRYTTHLRIAAGDRLSLVQPPHFSGTVSSVFAALLNGGVVCPYPLRERGFAPVAAWIAQAGITIFHSTPPIFRAMLEGAGRLPGVRVVRLEGDQALPSDVALFREHFAPHALLAVGLGATETGLSCQYRIDAQAAIGPGPLPVGRPAQDMAIVILDDDGREVERGRTGEIGVRSRYLALGYWRQPERTRAAFLPDPADPASRIYRSGDLGRLGADGMVEFVGRKDFRPRIRGQDVDCADVEAALVGIDGIREAAVVAREDPAGEPRLVAYVVAGDGVAPAPRAIRAALQARLADAAIPTAVVTLERLPRDGNGKLDRRMLRDAAMPAEAVAGVAPVAVDALEARIVALWERVLARDGIAPDDDFFDLGGDSLLAARIALAVERATGIALSPNALCAAPTARQLAQHVRDAGAAAALTPGSAKRDADELVVPLRPGNAHPPLFVVHDHGGSVLGYADLVRRLPEGVPCFGLRSPCEVSAQVPATLAAHAGRLCDAIRQAQRQGPYRLAGVCFGGVVALEVARQLEAAGERVALLAIIDVTPYDFPALVGERARRLFALHAQRAGVMRRLAYYRARVRGLRARAMLRYFSGRARLVAPFLRSRWRERVRPSEQVSVPTPVGERHSALFHGYEARPFAGRATLFLSASSVERYSSDPHGDWRGLAAGGVDVHLLPVAGRAMMEEPHVAALAAGLRDCLRSAAAEAA